MKRIQICTKCGSVYELSFTRTIMRDQDSIDCDVCAEQLHRWSEAKIWEARLIQRNENKVTEP